MTPRIAHTRESRLLGSSGIVRGVRDSVAVTADELKVTAEDRRQHLEFIQSVVGRMSNSSTLAKGWCLTVSTATLGFAATKSSGSVGLLGGLATLLFGFLDARYLREERKFRTLYDDARRGLVEPYSMDTRAYVETASDRLANNCQWRSVLRSWSVWGFYGPLLVVTVVVVWHASVNP